MSNVIIYDVFYSKCSHQHVSAGIPAIFRVALLQDHKSKNVVTCHQYSISIKIIIGDNNVSKIHHIYCSASLRYLYISKKVNQSLYRPGIAQRFPES